MMLCVKSARGSVHVEGCRGTPSSTGIEPLCLSLSGNQLEDEGCRLMAEAAPQLRIAGKLE